MSVFFTSDTHFHHAKILDYSNRPFSSLEEMHAALIANWNDVVGPDDTVYHLGDFSFATVAKTAEVFAQLNGWICVIGNPWHHDKGWIRDYGWDDRYQSLNGHKVYVLPPIHVLKKDGGQVLVLSHYPQADWDCKHHGSYHLHGHTHGTYQGSGRILDVGVDCHDYRPISLEEILARKYYDEGIIKTEN